MTSPMQRTKAVLKQRGISNQVVERYFPRSKKYPFGCKQDLFNIIDLVALDNGVVGIQVCGTDWKEHERKIMGSEKEKTAEWIVNGGRLELHGWRKVKKVRGKKAMVWKCRVADILLVDGELCFRERKESY